MVDSMIDHTGIRVTDMAKSVAFYTAALAPLGYTLLHQVPGGAGFGAQGKADFWLSDAAPPADKIHIAFRAIGRQIVRDFHAAALAAGAADNGAPGLRPRYHEHYYGGFVRDPDGHNIEACCHEAFLG